MFDPYHKWLGIPPKDQPPNHYRLLALDLFESDPEVIDTAANRQMAYLQQRATGEHAVLSQKLLNEISAARLCLLDLKKKSQYDEHLRTQIATQKVQVPGGGKQAEALAVAAGDRPRLPQKKQQSWQVLAAIAAGVLICLGIGAFLLTDGEKKKIAQSDVSEQAATKSKTEEAPVPPLSPVARKPQEEESPRLSSPPEVAKPIPPVPVEPAKEPPAKPAEKEKPEIAKEQPKEPPAPTPVPVAVNSPNQTPELVEASELNDVGGNDHPWLSEDGLTIYWDRTVNRKGSIWTARRESPQSPFTNQRELFSGKCPTVSSDTLEMVLVRDRTNGQKGRSLYATSREILDRPFPPPVEIAELSTLNVHGPCLSPDGLNLYFNRRPTLCVVSSTRASRSSPWNDPKLFADLDAACPSLTPDRLILLGHEDKPFKSDEFGDGNLVIWSRASAGSPFEKSRHVACDNGPVLAGGCPRYVAATRELFFSRVFITDGHQVRDKLPGIWIIKHFDLERVAVTQLGPPPAVAAVGGDQAHGQAENDSSVFVGEWVCNKGTIITLNADFTAARKDKPNLQGNWGYVNGEAHIDWNQGSRTVLRRDGEGFQKLFWGAGVSMDSPPSDTAPAVKKTPSEPPTPETPSQPAATWRTMGEYPLITGKWAEAEAKGIFVTIRQNGGKFVANCTYKNRKGEVHWHADGTISKDGEITASLVHTKPKGFKSQVRTGKLDPDGKTIKGRSTFDGGQNDFTWTLKEPTE